MAKIVDVKSSEFKGATLELDAKEFEFLYRLLGSHVTGGSSYAIFCAMLDVAKDCGMECEDFITEGNKYLKIKREE
jgi:hypothetical protein